MKTYLILCFAFVAFLFTSNRADAQLGTTYTVTPNPFLLTAQVDTTVEGTMTLVRVGVSLDTETVTIHLDNGNVFSLLDTVLTFGTSLTVDFNVKFKPTSPGLFYDTLVIRSTRSNGMTATTTMIGIGVSNIPKVPFYVAYPNPLLLAANVGQAVHDTVRIKNFGTVASVVTATARINGSSWYSILGDTVKTFTENTIFDIQFLPTTASVDSGTTLDITIGDSLYKVSLKGIVLPRDHYSWNKTSYPKKHIVKTIFVHPTSKSIFTGTDSNGIWRSTNGGCDWEMMSYGLASKRVHQIVQIGLDTVGVNTSYLFAATDSGVYRSSNQGLNWVGVNTGLTNLDVRSLTVADGGILFAGTNGSGVFMSPALGEVWLSPTDLDIMAGDVETMYSSPNAVFAGFNGGRIVRTTDAGLSWNLVYTTSSTTAMNTIVSGMPAAKGLPPIIYAGTGIGVLRSLDNGTSWSIMNNGFGANKNINALYADQTGIILAATDSGAGANPLMFQSYDIGNTWIQADSGLPVSAPTIAIGSGLITPIFAGTYGDGMYSAVALQCNPYPNLTEVPVKQGIDAFTAHSPSITKVEPIDPTSTDNPILVTAYTYQDGVNRKVGISRSIDGGTTWITPAIALEMPKWKNTTESLTNMDEAQITTLGSPLDARIGTNRPLLLVVRAWSADASTVKGNLIENSQDLGLIFRKSGIYVAVSLNKGNTWGYYNSSNEFIEGLWGTVAENDLTSGIATLEYPRLAYRPEYDNSVGYITWEKKVYTEVTIPGVGLGYHVSNLTRIGIRAFDRIGRQYSMPASDPKPYITFSDPGGTNTNGTQKLQSSDLPERASVAIAPDKQLWLSFYTIDYNTTGVKSGSVLPKMKVYYVSGTRDIITNPGTCAISITEAPTRIGNQDRHAMGAYKPEHGAIHFASINTLPDNDDEDFTEMEAGYRIDLAAGPSIQVVNKYSDHQPSIDYTSACNQEYEIGVLYCYGLHEDDDEQDWENGGAASDVDAEFSFHSNLSFYAGTAKFGQQASTHSFEEIDNNIAGVGGDPGEYNRDQKIRTDLRFFPVLKYTTVLSPLYCSYVNDEIGSTDTRVQSFFVIAYMGADQKTIRYGTILPDDDIKYVVKPNHFHNMEAFAGISYDYRTFKIDKFAPGRIPDGNEKYILAAEPQQDAGNNALPEVKPWEEFWGSKMDITGDLILYGLTDDFGNRVIDKRNWDLHPIWHRITPFGNGTAPLWQKLMTNTGNCILAQAYIPNVPLSLPEGMPKGNFFDETPSGDFPWGDYAYFDFNSANRPKDLLAKPEVTFSNTFGTLINQTPTTLINGKDFIKPFTATATDPVPYDYYYGIYKNTEAESGEGFLGTSNQRKIVMTDNIPHAVVERRNKVYYTISRGSNIGGGVGTTHCQNLPSNQDWTPLYQMSENNVDQYRPSIAVYQEGKDDEFSGKAAVAVTWVELKPSTTTDPLIAEIYLKVREFNVCEGKWNAWSEPYLIHKHKYTDPGGAIVADDRTTPVVAPLLKQDPYNTTSTILLGWTVSWNSPTLNPASSTTPSAIAGIYKSAVYSRTWLRHSGGSVITDNSNWGSYYHPDLLTTLFLSTFTGIQPNDFPDDWNKLYEHPNPTTNPSSKQLIDYPSVTSSESKGDFSRLQQEIAYSTDGSKAGIWHKTAIYHMTTATNAIGELQSVSPVVGNKGNLLSFKQKPGTSNEQYIGAYTLERKPCVTVNSSGQTFVSWERMEHFYYVYGKVGGGTWTVDELNSNIMSVNTDLSNKWWGINNKSNLSYVYREPASTMDFEWLLNPSITGFPKSRLKNETNPLLKEEDKDGGVVELLIWRQFQLNSAQQKIPSNRLLFPTMFYEEVTERGNGTWHATPKGPDVDNSPGGNSQRSFGQYNAGAIIFPPVGDFHAYPSRGTSYALGNMEKDVSIDDAHFVRPVPAMGAYKGTYTRQLPVSVYRGEEFYHDSSSIRFTWGNVLVTDTGSLSLEKQVILPFTPDTNGQPFSEMHDSLFRTEVFEWRPGTEISYWTGISFNDTVSMKPGGVFYDSAVELNYLVELVDASGCVDTIQTFKCSSSEEKFIPPRTTYLINTDFRTREVSLRVRVNTAGLTIADSTTEFRIEHSRVPYESYSPANYYYVRPGQVLSAVKESPSSVNIYPNPLIDGTENLNVSFSFPKGNPVSLTVYDYLGRQISNETKLVSFGDSQTIQVPAPRTTGAYILVVKSGEYFSRYPFTVIR